MDENEEQEGGVTTATPEKPDGDSEDQGSETDSEWIDNAFRNAQQNVDARQSQTPPDDQAPDSQIGENESDSEWIDNEIERAQRNVDKEEQEPEENSLKDKVQNTVQKVQDVRDTVEKVKKIADTTENLAKIANFGGKAVEVGQAVPEAVAVAGTAPELAAIAGGCLVVAVIVLIIFLVIFMFFMILSNNDNSFAPGNLKVFISAPEFVPNNTDVQYTIQVGYRGTADDVLVSDRLPQGTQLVSVQPAAKALDTNGVPTTDPNKLAILQWSLADIQKQQTGQGGPLVNPYQELSFTVKPLIPGTCSDANGNTVPCITDQPSATAVNPR